uniref:Uncharacterized protein n=1 Tax=Rhizophora mucronata TaxID=61149 RepID=A0A2P2NGS6_RHIMU
MPSNKRYFITVKNLMIRSLLLIYVTTTMLPFTCWSRNRLN